MPQSQTEHWDFSPQELPVPVKQFLKLSGFLSISVIFGPSSYAYGDSSCVTIDMQPALYGESVSGMWNLGPSLYSLFSPEPETRYTV